MGTPDAPNEDMATQAKGLAIIAGVWDSKYNCQLNGVVYKQHVTRMAAMEGASLARKFAQRSTVALLARNPASYSSVVDEIASNGGHATGFNVDVSDPASMRNACVQISGTFPDTRMTAAVYNVGGGFMRKPFLALTPEEFKAGYESNALGAFNFSQAAIPHLLKSASTAKDKCFEYPPPQHSSSQEPLRQSRAPHKSRPSRPGNLPCVRSRNL